MSVVENTPSEEIPESLVLVIGAFLLLQEQPGFASRGSIGFVQAKKQLLPLTFEDDE